MLLQPGPTGSVSPSGLCLEAIIFLASVSGKTWSTKYWFEFWNTSFDWCIMNSRLVVIHQPFKLAVTVLAMMGYLIVGYFRPTGTSPWACSCPIRCWPASSVMRGSNYRAVAQRTQAVCLRQKDWEGWDHSWAVSDTWGLQGKVVVSQCSSDYSTRWLCSHSTIGFVYTFNLAPCLCEADASLIGIPWAAGAIGPLGSLWGHHNWSIIT